MKQLAASLSALAILLVLGGCNASPSPSSSSATGSTAGSTVTPDQASSSTATASMPTFLETANKRTQPAVTFGDTLTFRSQVVPGQTTYYVHFFDATPCDQFTYAGTPARPPQCKVTQNPGDSPARYRYYLDDNPVGATPELSGSTTTKSTGGAAPESLERDPTWCDGCGDGFFLVQGKAHLLQTVIKQGAPVKRPFAPAAEIQLCPASDLRAAPTTVFTGQQVTWFLLGNGPRQWTIDLPQDVCTEGTEISTNANQFCTIKSAPRTITYKLQVPEGCQGEAKLIITKPPVYGAAGEHANGAAYKK